MRVTTQMLNNAAAKAGIPVNRSSLLNYINGNSSNVSLANSLSKTQKSDSAKKADYEKLETSADEAVKSMDKLLTSGGENITASDLQSFVDRYNEMLKSLSKTSDTLNNFYAQMIKDPVKGCQKELAQLGITMAKDGTLSFDKAKFEKFSAELSAQSKAASANETTAESTAEDAADETVTDTAEDTAADTTSEAAKTPDSVKQDSPNLNTLLDALFNQKSGLFSRLQFLAARISDNANANAQSFSNYYNGYGAKTNAYSNGKYNFWS